MQGNYTIRIRNVPTFYFIGLTTRRSFMRQIFPQWMEALGRPEVALEGVDLPLRAHPEAYRRVVAQIKHDTLSIGGLVTTHKIDLYQAAADMFDDLDDYAKISKEIACISKRDGALIGVAVDPITAGLSLDSILGRSYFGRTGGEVLCFGAGGAGSAIALNLTGRPARSDQPRRFTLVDLAQDRLDRMRQMVESQATDIDFKYIHNADARVNDSLLEGMPAGSLIINATGMGKDTPGSPLTQSAVFPPRAVVWELNYRGELDFYHQALSQRESQDLSVEDGWLYFLYGWTTIIGVVLGIEMTAGLFERLAQMASPYKPPERPTQLHA